VLLTRFGGEECEKEREKEDEEDEEHRGDASGRTPVVMGRVDGDARDEKGRGACGEEGRATREDGRDEVGRV
jgi:hypothetical protein